jgi:hypothetical protein
MFAAATMVEAYRRLCAGGKHRQFGIDRTIPGNFAR